VSTDDGEASHPHVDATIRLELARVRPAETRAALGALGCAYTMKRLRQPDGDIDFTALADALTTRCGCGTERSRPIPASAGTTVRRVPLPPPVVAAKGTAIEAFTSQITPIDGVTIRPEDVLTRFRRPFEVVFG
jgi:hypothetical protein